MTKIKPQFRMLGEPSGHVKMRHAKVLIGVLLLIAVCVTILMTIVFRPAAPAAAFTIPVFFLLYLFVWYLEKQSRANVIRVKGETAISEEEIEMDVDYARIYGLASIGGLVALSVVMMIAATLVDWAIFGVAAATLFMLSVFIMLPYIPLFLNDMEEDERKKVTPQITTDKIVEPPRK